MLATRHCRLRRCWRGCRKQVQTVMVITTPKSVPKTKNWQIALEIELVEDVSADESVVDVESVELVASEFKLFLALSPKVKVFKFSNNSFFFSFKTWICFIVFRHNDFAARCKAVSDSEVEDFHKVSRFCFSLSKFVITSSLKMRIHEWNEREEGRE